MNAQTEPAIANGARSEVSATPVSSPSPESAQRPKDADIVLDDLLVEDVSIDGMCGVY